MELAVVDDVQAGEGLSGARHPGDEADPLAMARPSLLDRPDHPRVHQVTSPSGRRR